jgi:sec-independent protein translocase protein TatB
MFNIGFWELAIIAVIALLVVGPQKLPELARQAGTWIGHIRRFVNSARADIERELGAEELRRALHKQQDEIRRLEGMISDTQAELKNTEALKQDEKPTSPPAKQPDAGDNKPA